MKALHILLARKGTYGVVAVGLILTGVAQLVPWGVIFKYASNNMPYVEVVTGIVILGVLAVIFVGEEA